MTDIYDASRERYFSNKPIVEITEFLKIAIEERAIYRLTGQGDPDEVAQLSNIYEGLNTAAQVNLEKAVVSRLQSLSSGTDIEAVALYAELCAVLELSDCLQIIQRYVDNLDIDFISDCPDQVLEILVNIASLSIGQEKNARFFKRLLIHSAWKAHLSFLVRCVIAVAPDSLAEVLNRYFVAASNEDDNFIRNLCMEYVSSYGLPRLLEHLPEISEDASQKILRVLTEEDGAFALKLNNVSAELALADKRLIAGFQLSDKDNTYHIPCDHNERKHQILSRVLTKLHVAYNEDTADRVIPLKKTS